MADTLPVQMPRTITVTVLEDESALLDIEGQTPIALCPQEAALLHILLNYFGKKKAGA